LLIEIEVGVLIPEIIIGFEIYSVFTFASSTSLKVNWSGVVSVVGVSVTVM